MWRDDLAQSMLFVINKQIYYTSDAVLWYTDLIYLYEATK